MVAQGIDRGARRLQACALAASSVASIALAIEAPCVLASLGFRAPGIHSDPRATI
jgi:hypothetical protein